MPVVSVIIPVYNVELYLDECLESVCKQTLKDIEIICINDGSTDRSLQILQKYAKHDERIIIINQENHGVSYTRNTGIRKAAGKYIYFLDSDDYIAYDALEVLVAAMEANDLEMLLFNAKVFGDENIEDDRIRAEINYYKRIHEYPAVCKGEDLYRLLRENKEFVAPVSMYLINKDFIINNRFLFAEDIIHEDELYTFQCLTVASRAGYTGKELYYRRVRDNSIMDFRTRPEKMILSVFSCFVCVKQMLSFCKSAEFREENEDAIFSGIERMSNICRDRYGTLDETARAEVLKITGKDIFLFKALILTSFNSNERIKNLKSEVLNKTARLEKEKEDALTKVTRLEKNNKNALAKVSLLQKKSEKLNNELHNVKNGWSFRIGRVITFVPRKIKSVLAQEKNGTSSLKDKPAVEPYAFIRVKNEAITLKASLNSILPVIRKGVIAYNDCTDGSDRIIRDFCKKNPGFIPFHYPHHVVGKNHPDYATGKIPYENTLAAYYNAALSLIPQNSWLIKIDCDHVYFPDILKRSFSLPKGSAEVVSYSRLDLIRRNHSVKVIGYKRPGDHWLIYNKNLKFINRYGYDKKGNYYAWEFLVMPEEYKILYRPECSSFHFPVEKSYRNFSIEEDKLLSLEQFRKTADPKEISPDILEDKVINRIISSFEYNRIKGTGPVTIYSQFNQLIKKIDDKIYRSRFKPLVTKYFYYLPAKKKRVCFCNFAGKGYGDNPKYIAEEIHLRDPSYQLFWLVNDKSEPEFPEYIHAVNINSVKALYIRATSKIWINNIRNDHPVRKKKSQLYLQTWHAAGLNWKCVEADAEKRLHKEYVAKAKYDGQITDGILACGKRQEELFKRAFWLNEKAEILHYGLPRNDYLVNNINNTKTYGELRKKLGLEEHIFYVLYAPTFRDDHSLEGYKLNFDEIIKALKNKLQKEVKIIVRLHPNVSFQSKFIKYNESIINGTFFPDAQELSLVCDCLITDYSSIATNFLLMHKPIFIFALDLQDYMEKRGLLPDYFDSPLPMAKTNEQLIALIKQFSIEEYTRKADEWFLRNPLYDDGHAAEKTVQWIFDRVRKK